MTGHGRRQPPAGERTRRRHRELAQQILLLLRHRYTERLPLQEIAAGLNVSPGFLCRVFRRETGDTIHSHLTALRLSRALELLAGREGEDLTRLGLELGFASHSHFTSAFRRRFGVPPSVIRGHLLEQARALPEPGRAAAAPAIEQRNTEF